jgi:hypothetical protein
MHISSTNTIAFRLKFAEILRNIFIKKEDSAAPCKLAFEFRRVRGILENQACRRLRRACG